jgi:hypothetical protein
VSEESAYYYVVSALKNAGESAASKEAKSRILVNAGLHAVFPDAKANAFEGAAKAFDGTNAKWFTGGGQEAATLQADFGDGKPVAVVRYDIVSGKDVPARDPRDWEFQASNDGLNWITLDKRQGENFAARFQTNHYSISNTTPYRYYRLNILSNFGSDPVPGIQLTELMLLVEREPKALTKPPNK